LGITEATTTTPIKTSYLKSDLKDILYDNAIKLGIIISNSVDPLLKKVLHDVMEEVNEHLTSGESPLISSEKALSKTYFIEVDPVSPETPHWRMEYRKSKLGESRCTVQLYERKDRKHVFGFVDVRTGLETQDFGFFYNPPEGSTFSAYLHLTEKGVGSANPQIGKFAKKCIEELDRY
jgi:hypothetical protein